MESVITYSQKLYIEVEKRQERQFRLCRFEFYETAFVQILFRKSDSLLCFQSTIFNPTLECRVLNHRTPPKHEPNPIPFQPNIYPTQNQTTPSHVAPEFSPNFPESPPLYPKKTGRDQKSPNPILSLSNNYPTHPSPT